MIIILHIPYNLASIVSTLILTGAQFFLDTERESNLLVLRGTSTPRSTISDISNDTAISRINVPVSNNLFWFGAGTTKKRAAHRAPEFKPKCVPRKVRTMQKAKHAAPEGGTQQSSQQTFRAMLSMGIKRKIADRDNTLPSEFDGYESETPTCKLPKHNN